MPFTPPPSPEERRTAGKALRDRLPRTDQGTFEPKPRPDLLAQLQAAVEGRDPSLLPHRWARMAESPFGFYRGTAALMAEDLRPRPAAGLTLTLCGDAHLLNLGAYADADRRLLFDLNDFDEACTGPFEWDLKRLAASFVVGGQVAGCGEAACLEAVRGLVRAWREGVHDFAELPYDELARVEVRPEDGHAPLAPMFEKAARDTPARLLAKATAPDPEGWPSFVAKLPNLRPLGEAEAAPAVAALASYASSLPAPWRHLLSAYRPREVARRASGCGSFGVLDWLVLLVGRDPQDALFLELKAQGGSCWRPTPGHRGQAVAQAAQVLQTWSDPFLGWSDVEGRPVLVRQWSDHKAGLELEDLGTCLEGYAALCGRVLAKAQARAGDASTLAGYAGRSDKLDEALAAFAARYARQVDLDYRAFQELLRQGRLPLPA
ncbi:MAG TPA: DUF2252 domain-containing protein [Holophagaceae bacterium]|nr:DUF2252 domain-containing protein [Holophagaceae bacterium]